MDSRSGNKGILYEDGNDMRSSRYRCYVCGEFVHYPTCDVVWDFRYSVYLHPDKCMTVFRIIQRLRGVEEFDLTGL